MAKKFSIKKLAAGVLALLMVVTALPVSGVTATVSQAADETADALAVYRSYNPNSGEHFMTTNESEHQSVVDAGRDDEGIAWYAPSKSQTPVYRAYNPNTGEHLLVPQAEAEWLATQGWNNEGLKIYSDDAKGNAVYRVYNPNATDAGSHLYTSNKEEAEYLVGLGWKWDNDGQPLLYGLEEVAPGVKLTNAEQTTASGIKITLDSDATGRLTKEDVEVKVADGDLVIPVNSLTVSEDGLSAELVLATALTDGVDYTVSLNDSASTFTASVGEVYSIVILTTTAPEKVKTNIEFKLFDENGIDVTDAVAVDTRCSVSIEGTGITTNTAKASTSTITMDEEGQEAIVKITYNSGKKDAEDIEQEGVITCVAADALVGSPLYADVTDVVAAARKGIALQDESESARFYLGALGGVTTKPIPVEVDGTNNNIFFCAVGEDGIAISYDSYEIESSDDDTFNVSTQVDSGKYARMAISGNKVGNGTIMITAKSNGKETPYTIPVSVTKKGELDKITVTLTRSTMTNAIDSDYKGKVVVTAYDSNGRDITSESAVACEIVDENKKAGATHVIDEMSAASWFNTGVANKGFYLNTTSNEYTAYADKGGTQNIRVSVSKEGVVKEKTVGVSVEALPKTIWNNAGANQKPVKLTYTVELGKSSLVENAQGDHSTTAKLAAYYGGKFVGYVRKANGTATYPVIGDDVGASGINGANTGSSILCDESSTITNIRFGVKFGNKYAYAGTGTTSLVRQSTYIDKSSLVGQSTNITTAAGQVIESIDETAISSGNAYYVGDGDDRDYYFAKTGTYYPTFYYNLPGKDNQIAQASLGVGFGYAVPTVKVKNRNVDSLAEADIYEVLSTNVDMNNNTSEHESIKGLVGARSNNALNGTYTNDYTTFSNLSTDNNKVTVKYAVVKDFNINFIVPLNTTFKTE